MIQSVFKVLLFSFAVLAASHAFAGGSSNSLAEAQRAVGGGNSSAAAAVANSIAAAQCQANCKARGINCATSCTPGRCYYVSATRPYCIR